MTDENLDAGNDGQSANTPVPGESGTSTVDVDAIRAEIRSELSHEWEKEKAGLIAAEANQRKKRQEAEERLNGQSTTTSVDPDSIEEIVNKRLEERDAQVQQEKEVSRVNSIRDSAFQKLDESKELFGETDPKEVAASVGEVLASVGESRGFNKDLQLQLMQSENSPQLFKALHDDPELLKRIATANPIEQGKLLAGLEAKAKPGVSVTSAPDPINPLSGGAGDVDIDSISDQGQYETTLRKQNGGSVFPRSR